ncbi:MAG: ATP-binding protein [Candidatus Aenigmatarchaeota archaeon]
MQEIGTIISSPEASSTKFSFVVNQERGLVVRKGQFAQLETEEGLLIARISEIFKTNRYFTRAESVREYERSGKSLPDFFPVERWEYLVADAIPLGIFSGGMQKRVTFPPSPGLKVFLADEKILFEFLGLDEKGLDIGKIEFHELNAKLNLTRLFQKHCSILAQTGAGKSYFVSCLIEEILDRDDKLGKPALIVVDPHGEYLGFCDDEKYARKTKIFNENTLKIAAYELSINQIYELQPFVSPVEKRELAKIIEKLKEEKIAYSLDELIAAIEISDIKSNTKAPLISWLNDLNSTGLFTNVTKPTMEELAKSGQLSVIDLSNFISLRDKQVIVTFIARKLFEARRANKIPPFILFIEESHQFAPEREERFQAISKSIIETIAREGRKFGASLVLISQRPVQLSVTALSQCNSSILLRITNPYDLDHIARSCEGITRDILQMLPGLKTGEAIVTGAVVNYPLIVKIRKRKSKESTKIGINLEDASLSFISESEKSKKDLEAFM